MISVRRKWSVGGHGVVYTALEEQSGMWRKESREMTEQKIQEYEESYARSVTIAIGKLIHTCPHEHA